MSLLSLAVANAAVACLLALLAAMVSWRTRGRPALAYGLWLLVLLKLVTPPFLRVPLPGPAASPGEGVSEPELVCPTEAEAGPPMLLPLEEDHPQSAPIVPAWGLEEWALAVWAAGAGVLWLTALWRIIALRRLIAQLPDASPALQDRVAALAARLGLRRAPSVRLLPGTCLPPLVVAPGWRAWLLLPEGLWRRLGAEERDAVLLHELAHLRRGDHRVRWLELLALGLYWWLPVAWWARRRLRQAEEECCDAWVVWAAPAARPAYAAALVETVAFLSGQPAALPVGASGAGPVVALKRRLELILQGTARRGLSWSGWVMVLSGLLLLPLMPTRAAERAPRRGDTGMTLETVLASKACVSCHGPAKKEAGSGAAGDAHDRVVRLLDELKKQRESLTKTEAALREALDKFEKAAQPRAKGPAKTSREKELEGRIEKLTQELEALRREVRRRDVGFGRDEKRLSGGHKFYSPHRQIALPIRWSEGSGLKEAALLVRAEGETKFEMVKKVNAGTRTVEYKAPKDGTYAFYLLAIGDGPRTREDPPTAHLTVVVDTDPPVIELYHGGGRGKTPLVIQWTAKDANLVANPVKLEVRKQNHTTWADKTTTAAAKGSATLSDTDIAEFRLTVLDRAGNRAVLRRWVNRDE